MPANSIACSADDFTLIAEGNATSLGAEWRYQRVVAAPGQNSFDCAGSCPDFAIIVTFLTGASMRTSKLPSLPDL
jgi:hypothetical protein